MLSKFHSALLRRMIYAMVAVGVIAKLRPHDGARWQNDKLVPS